jgi:L-alanine-DL-glutamate epimerase-like enolase superfamily enzyme
MTRYQFREVVEQGIAQFVMPDICWCGGISEAKNIASMAETYYLPIALHNCGGPVLHFASMHLAMNVTNLFILESVRRHYLKEYQGIVSNTGPSKDGWLEAPASPGLGVELDSAVFSRPDLSIQSFES